MTKKTASVRIKHDYIDNKKFHREMTKYRLAVIAAEENDLDKPKLNNYLGECLYLICYKLSFRPNFINYSFKEEMVGDAIENCLAAVDNFDPYQEKNNPFGYFSLIAWRAFLRRIEKEKKQSYIKHKVYQESGIHMQLESESASPNIDNDVSSRIIETFESKMNVKKKPKVKGVEKFLGE